MRHLLLLPLLPLLAACSGEKPADASTCTDADGLDDGVATATVDDAAWSSAGTWLWQGSSVQITTTPADGWNITLVGRTLADGTTVEDAVTAGAFPVEVVLDEAGGGFATVYPSDGSSYSTDAGGGTLVFTALDEDVLAACFDFTAARDGGAEVAVADGAVRASLFEM